MRRRARLNVMGTKRVYVSLADQIACAHLPAPVAEYRFCARRFRFDLAWPDRMLACEVDGAVWTRGRHARGGGISSDCEKFSLAAIHGWRVLRVTTEMVKSGLALFFVTAALDADRAPEGTR